MGINNGITNLGTLVDTYINTAYDKVEEVSDNLTSILAVANQYSDYQASATEPTTKEDGSPLGAGDTYFNTTTNLTYLYNDVTSTWVAMSNMVTTREVVAVTAGIAASGTVPLVNPYTAGSGNLILSINGAVQNETNYTQTGSNTVDFGAGVLQEGDMIATIVGVSLSTIDATNISYTPTGGSTTTVDAALKADPTRRYNTLAQAVADIANISEGDVLELKERTTGNGGGGTWDVISDAGAALANTYDIVESGDGLLSFQLRVGDVIDAVAFGFDPTGATYNAIGFNLITQNIHFDAGTYKLETKYDHTTSDITVSGNGDGSTILTTATLPTLLEFTANVSNVTFKDVTFRSTVSNAVENVFGVVLAHDVGLSNVTFLRCGFECETNHINAVKVINQGTEITDNLKFIECRFENVGRMAIELQNHNFDTLVDRFKNILVEKCTFKNLGLFTLYGMGVSLSGQGNSVRIINNTFDNCYNTAIEGTTVSNTVVSGNTFNNFTRVCSPISWTNNAPLDYMMYGNTFSNNSGGASVALNGNINLFAMEGMTFSNNTFVLDGHFRMQSVAESVISNNRLKLKGVTYGVKLESVPFATASSVIDCANNIIEGNTFDNSASTTSAHTVVFDKGASGGEVTNNIFRNNMFKKATSGFDVSQVNGAIGNFIFDSVDSGNNAALGQYLALVMSDADYDFTANQYAVIVPKFIKTTGTLTATRNFKLPDNIHVPFLFFNNTAQSLVLTTPTGTGDTIVSNGKVTVIYDGTAYRVL